MLFAIRGYGDQGAARIFARMRALAARLGDAPLQLRAMDGLLLVHTMRAEYTAAQALAEEMIVLAERLGNPVAMATTRVTLGAALFNLGELEAAARHGERVRALLDTEAPRLPAIFGISSCCLLSSVYAHLGRIAHARAMQAEALARATAYGVPYLRAHATNYAAQACAVLRDVAGARILAEETVHLATEYGFSVFRVTGTMVLGWCHVEEGRVDDGLAALGGAFREYGMTGQRISFTAFGVLLATAHLTSGDIAGATQAVDGSLAFAAETGERVNESELYRLQGECLLAGTPTDAQRADATARFERALAIAADRKALLFELRAARSLYRVDPKAARARFARLVDRFGAADDCADLRASRMLLGARVA